MQQYDNSYKLMTDDRSLVPHCAGTGVAVPPIRLEGSPP